jgi:hypothetical protein
VIEAAALPKFTDVAPFRRLPKIWTDVPPVVWPVEGWMESMTGFVDAAAPTAVSGVARAAVPPAPTPAATATATTAEIAM